MSEEFERVARQAGQAWRKRIGLGLRNARDRRDMSQTALADLIGANVSTISEIERGVSTPSLGTVWAIADRLGLPIDIVVGRSSPNEIFEALIPEAAAGAESPSMDPWVAVALLQQQLDELRTALERGERPPRARSTTPPSKGPHSA